MMWFLFAVCNMAAESIQRTFIDNMELHFTRNLEMACNDSSSKKMCRTSYLGRGFQCLSIVLCYHYIFAFCVLTYGGFIRCPPLPQAVLIVLN